ncbi:TlpA family protein disulfide reductase [Anaerobacillus alkaliphilus]|uniref:TlpA family protein disulfide reductase n=1 Tax=Anaerobacillus alkaliphilus TaxID=1548597 RepID=A0A4Q0VVV7_9BACI|nr:TlpA family protein disulfide reductase [Anaerobacillus alkaliphilus]RXJ03827.1 TlpA family protein disulfide reductase [Anaerobacillus alkaliphilus]
MTNNRFISFMILLIALAFIIYVLVDNISIDNKGTEDNLLGDDPYVTKDEVGLLRGMYAPDFTLPLFGTEDERSLSDFHGNIVVLNLWASWCPPCRDEMPDLIKLDNQYKGKGVKVVGVNMATLERNEGATEQFMEEFNVNFPTFIDLPTESTNQRGIVESLYQVRALPATYILDEQGRIFISIRGKVTFEMLENEILKILK